MFDDANAWIIGNVAQLFKQAHSRQSHSRRTNISIRPNVSLWRSTFVCWIVRRGSAGAGRLAGRGWPPQSINKFKIATQSIEWENGRKYKTNQSKMIALECYRQFIIKKPTENAIENRLRGMIQANWRSFHVGCSAMRWRWRRWRL